MSEDRTIPSPAPVDKPTFTIKSNGIEVSKEFQMLSLVVSKQVNKISTATLLFHDGKPNDENFTISNGDVFIPGNEIEIYAGYHSEEDLLFKGIVVNLGVRAKKDKSSLLKVVCKDEAVKLSVGRKSKYFYDLLDSDAIEELADEAGLDKDIEATSVTHKELVQFNCTSWDFIVSRAEANGKLVYTNNGTLALKKPELSQEPVLALTFGGNIMGFEAEMDARTQYDELKSTAWNSANQEMSELDAESFTDGLPGNVSTNDLSSVIGLESYNLYHGGQVTEDELQEWVNAGQQKSKLSKIRGRILFQGSAGITPGDMVELGGMSDRFNGKAFVSGVHHEINSNNWETNITIGLSPDWYLQSKTHISEPKAGGLLPAINGLQIGIVTKLEEDPDGEYRVQVRIPMIDASEEGVWARVATLDAGENRGSFFRPELEDEVIIGFLNDDPRNPVILGVLNSSAKPAPVEPTDDNHEKGFYTRSGMKVVFDDEKQTILIQTVNENKLLLSDDEGTIKLEDENGNNITMSSDGILFESAKDILFKASGDVITEGTNIESKANASFKAEGSGGAELSTSATAVLKGSIVQIN